MLSSFQLIKESTKEYYNLLSQLPFKNRVVWSSSMGPVELLRAFGFEVYFPEHHAVLISVDKMDNITIPIALSYQFFTGVCSYMISDIGAYIKGLSPLKIRYGIETIPSPLFLLATTLQCNDIGVWFEFFSRKLNSPLFVLPGVRYLDTVSNEIVEGYTLELKRFVNWVQVNFEIELDYERLEENVKNSYKASELWSELLDFALEDEPKIDFFDSLFLMAPQVLLRGSNKAIEIYTKIIDELRQLQFTNRKGYKRIYWEGMPIWHRLSYQKSLFERLGLKVVASTYCNSWIFREIATEKDPLKGIAKALLSLFIVRSNRAKFLYIKEMVDKFKIDGIIFHRALSCPYNSNSDYGLPERIKNELSLPVLIIEADFADSRAIQWRQIEIQLENFRESL